MRRAPRAPGSEAAATRIATAVIFHGAESSRVASNRRYECMKKIVIIAVIVAAALAGVAFYSGMFSRNSGAQAAGAQEPAVQGGGAQGRQGGARGGGGRGQLTVELAPVVHAEVNRELAVVGNLVGDQT